MNRTFYLVLGAFVVAGMMAVPAHATFIYDSTTNGVIFNDNFEGQSLGYLGSATASPGIWSSYAGAGSSVNVVNAATGGFAANEGSQYLQISRPDQGVNTWANGVESESKDFDTIVAKFAFRLNTGGNLTVMPAFEGTELAELYLKPDGTVNVLKADQSVWIPLTQTQTVGAWNTITISRTNGDFTNHSQYGSDYSVSVNGQTPETMPQLTTGASYQRLEPFTQLEFNGQGGVASIDAIPAPEPSTVALLATGLIGLLAYAWRKQK